MLIKKLLLTILASFAIVLGAVAIVIACRPSPEPPACPQSIYLGKFAPSTLLIPPDGSDFTATIGIFPFVTWDPDTPQCAQPASAMVTFELDCTDITGATFDLGPEMFAQPTPRAPGPQPVGGASVDFPVPGGTLPSVCSVMGTYEVDFAAGIGVDLAGTGDLEICLVEPSPSDPTFPRIELELIPLELTGEPGVVRRHQGDQSYIFIKAFNNDLMRSATFNFFSEGTQVAGFPDGFDDDAAAYNAGVFRIADGDADVFPVDFFFDEDPLPFDRIPGDPLSTDPGRIDGEFMLEPGEVEVFGIAINSFGACADGSCNERNICAEVELNREGFEPDKAFACVQFLYVVDNALPPTYPGLTIKDAWKTHPDSEVEGSTVQFFDADGGLIDETHHVNKLDGRIQIVGDNIRQPPPFPGFDFPGTWKDQITLPEPPSTLTFDFFVFDSRDAVGGLPTGGQVFFAEHSTVTIDNLNPDDGDCVLPALSFLTDNDPAVPVTSEITFNLPDGCRPDSQVDVTVAGLAGTFQFDLEALGELEAFGFRVDFESCRTFSFPQGNNLNAPLLVPHPPRIVHNFGPPDPLAELLRLLDQMDNPVDFEAELQGPDGLTLNSTSGTGDLFLTFDPSVIQPGLDTREWTLLLRNDNFINSPLEVPILARRRLPPPILLPPPDFVFDPPPLAQVEPVGPDYDAGIFIPPLDPQPIDPYINMEFFMALETNDPIEFRLPPQTLFGFVPIDPDTPEPELERLRGKFGEDPINKCSEGVWKCGKIEFGDGFEFETEIFVDGFESGDISSWSTGAAADNSETKKKETPVGVLNEDKKLPVITEEELRKAIELFNDDTVFDEKTIGLVSERFGIMEPLPPAEGTYFFDEFESFRKGAQAPVVLDGSRCPSPCSGLVLEGANGVGGGVSNLRFQNFPDYGVVIRNDSLWIASNEFSGNGAGGLLINGNNNFVSDSLLRANHFEENGGPAIVVESGTGNRLLFNTFTHVDSLWLAIDLGGDGITPNDDGDRDSGPNNLQNFPVLTSVLTGGSTTIQGLLNSTPNSDFRLQFYAQWDSFFHDLGIVTVSTDANGDARIDEVIDITVEIGQIVYVTATGAAGNTSEFSAPFEVVTGVATEGPEEVPATFTLDQNYPNPFNPSTTITYAVPEASPVRLEVFDLLGRLVAVLVDEMRSPGSYEVVFDASGLPSGAYFYKMTGERFSQTKSLMLLK